MISCKADYKVYLKADRKANRLNSKFSMLKSIQWKYLKRLRFSEYVINCISDKYGLLGGVIKAFAMYRLRQISVKTGITIPPNTFGKGLYIPHYGCIVVNGSARFGDNCIVQCGVNVSEGVQCGDNIYLGAGAKLLINVRLQSGTIVGANAVVNKSFEESNIVLAGIPAKIVSNKGMLSGRKKI